jgi:hypothetical protein
VGERHCRVFRGPSAMARFVGLARTVHICTVYDRTLDEIPAKISVYKPYM